MYLCLNDVEGYHITGIYLPDWLSFWLRAARALARAPAIPPVSSTETGRSCCSTCIEQSNYLINANNTNPCLPMSSVKYHQWACSKVFQAKFLSGSPVAGPSLPKSCKRPCSPPIILLNSLKDYIGWTLLFTK